MKIYQPISRPLDETQATVSNEAAATVVAVQVAAPDEHAPKGKGSEGGAPETAPAPPRVHHQFTLPLWPTSQLGSKVTSPSPGQRLVPFRTEQAMYDYYDQERGRPGIIPPTPTAQESASDGEPAETRQTTFLGIVRN